MQAVRPSTVLLIGSEPAATEQVHHLLTIQGHNVHCLRTDESLPDEASSYHLAIVEASGCPEEKLSWCQQLRARGAELFLPLLYITPDPSAGVRLASFDAGADACLVRPFLPEELLAQVNALLRIRQVQDRLTEKTAEVHRVNRRLQQAYQQIDQELELARRLQVSFLPQRMPDVPPARFAVHYLLCGQVGGDFYDVFRLDENHVGFYVADAMGHGVPASLLTIFVKKGVKPKEVFGQQYRLVPPGEVLQKLNKDLIDQALSDQPFITMVYVLFNHRDGTLRFSRAGHPYPLHVPRHGELKLWRTDGLLLGVFDAQFHDDTHRIVPGDKVLLYSDGIDAARFEDCQPGADSLLACAARHRSLPVQEFVQHLASALFAGGKPPDDLTLLGLEMLAS